jgi:hypothetical protein
VEIRVHEKGGVLGVDRRVEVKDGTLTVVVNGVPRARRKLDPVVEERLLELVARLPKRVIISPYSGSRIADTLETTIHITDDGREQRLRVQSGDDAPDQLWEFLGALTEISPE